MINYFAIICISLLMLVNCICLMKWQGIYKKIIALNSITNQGIAILVLLSLGLGRSSFIDAALIYAITSCIVMLVIPKIINK